MVLELVGNDEGHLRRAGILKPVITADRDDLAVVLDHVGHPVEAIDAGEVCDFGGLELGVWVEIAQLNRPAAEVCMEPDERRGVGRLNRPHGQVRVGTSTVCASRKRLGLNHRHRTTMTLRKRSR